MNFATFNFQKRDQKGDCPCEMDTFHLDITIGPVLSNLFFDCNVQKKNVLENDNIPVKSILYSDILYHAPRHSIHFSTGKPNITLHKH